MPATELLLDLSDGRKLAYALFGDEQGVPLFFFHGLPGSRLQAALIHESALEAGVCVIAPDRPGFGLSTPAPKRVILDWPKDVAALADALGHRKFAVLGVSCGGPYALACAHEFRDRISHVGLMAGMAPMDVPHIRHGQLRMLKVMFGLSRIHPLLASPMLWLDRLMFRSNPERAVQTLMSLLTPPDRQLLASNQEVRSRFALSLSEAYRQGIAGARRDVFLIASPRGFELENVLPEVQVYQGGHDGNVPPEMGQYLADQLPHGRLHMFPDEGHLSILLAAAAECLRDVRAAGR